MKWYQKVKNLFIPKAEMTMEDEEFLKILGVDVTSINVSGKNALKEATVFACLKIRSDTMSKLPLKLYQKLDGVQTIRGHSLSTLLSLRPNPYMSASNYWNCIENQKNVYGNAYVYIDYGVGRKSAEITALYPMDSSRMKIYVDNDGLLGIKNGLVYIFTDKNGVEHKLGSDDILHYRGMTLDGIAGLSVLEYNKTIIENAKSSQIYINKFFKGGMQSKGIIQYVGDLDSAAKETFRTKFESMSSGLKNAHRISLLPIGYQFQSISLSMTDAQFLENTELTIRQIAAMFGVKMHQLGDLSKATYSNITEQQKQYYVDTLQSDLTMYEQETTYKLLLTDELKKGYYCKFNTDVILRSDIKTRFETYRIGIQSGFYKINEVREKEEMASVEGGDKLYFNGNMIPVDMAGQQYTGGEKNSKTKE